VPSEPVEKSPNASGAAALRPTPEQLSVLSPMERIAFDVADVSLRRFTPLAVAYNLVVMGGLIWSCGGRRLHVHGLEHLRHLSKDSSILLVANHRSFFDFFVISSVVYYRTHLSKKILFPTRSTFFYDHPLGPAVNLAMSGMRMFPPVMRDKKKLPFNNYTVERCVAELARPGTVLGMHPEGTRNKGPDPYAFLPAHPGVGRIALAVPHCHIVPVFVLGMGNNLAKEFVDNWARPEETRIDLYFGPEVDISDLRKTTNRAATQKRVADRSLAAIKKLADQHRELMGGGAEASPAESPTDAP
jgi:1-acyl-sn-glycerol-3-phosphate acyltransferase